MLAVDENLRYGPLKAGYHGGASPAEVVVPVVVLVPGAVPDGTGLTARPAAGTGLVDSTPSPPPAPTWHRRRVAGREPPAAPSRPAADLRRRRPTRPTLTLFDEPEPEPAPASRTYDRRRSVSRRRPRPCSRSPAYAAQKRVAGRVSVTDDQVRGAARRPAGRSQPPAVPGGGRGGARRCRPVTLRGAVLHVQQLLNVEGYPVLRIDADGATVILDEACCASSSGSDRDRASVSPRRRREVIDALRRGTVPANGLDLLAVGLDRFTPALDADLDAVAGGGAAFKAVRGEYGSGKTFLTRYLAERALRHGFATAEVQISETETPLHKLETVYRRIGESLRTAAFPPSAFRAGPRLLAVHARIRRHRRRPGLAERADEARQRRRRTAPGAAARRRLRPDPGVRAGAARLPAAVVAGDAATADALAAWLGGQPHVAAAAKRSAGIRGELDHFGALGFLQGLLDVLRDAGHPGLLLVLDEVETLQRVRGDVRDKALNALRQLIDEIDAGRYPGLFLVITGHARLLRRAQRRAAAAAAGAAAGHRLLDRPPVRQPARRPAPAARLRPRRRCSPSAPRSATSTRTAPRTRTGSSRPSTTPTSRELADAVTGALGGKVGVAPRVFLKKLVADVLDRVDQFPDFDPRRHYTLTAGAGRAVRAGTERRRGAAPSAARADDIDLDLP